MSFARIGKNLRSKYSQKFLGHDKQSVTDEFKTTSKRAIQKTAGASGYFIGNKICDKITKFSETSPQNNSETVTNEEEKCMSPEQRQNIIDDLRLIQ